MEIIIDEEIVQKLASNNLYIQLKENCKDVDKDVLTLVEKAVSYSSKRTKTVLRNMGQYTLHDEDHLFRVLKIMELLISATEIEKLSTPELMLLILSAFFQDIGMAPTEKEVLAWRKVWDTSPSFESDEEKEEFTNFNNFIRVRQKKLTS